MSFPLTTRSMTLDDLEPLKVRIFINFADKLARWRWHLP